MEKLPVSSTKMQKLSYGIFQLSVIDKIPADERFPVWERVSSSNVLNMKYRMNEKDCIWWEIDHVSFNKAIWLSFTKFISW